ncbi:MAG: hypothetical protein OWR62_15295 [Sulfobacillus thermotolerans]|nr:hypothetical protein [Sulfobacillus thermotolerans]
MGMLRSELYRAFHRKGPYLTILLGVLVIVGGYASTYFGQIVWWDKSVNEYNVWYIFLQTIGDNWSSPWGFILPLLAVLPFGDTLIYDLNHGFEIPLILRVGARPYFFIKWVANFVVVIAVFSAVLCISLIIAVLWRHDFQMPFVLSEERMKGSINLTPAALAVDKLHHWNGVFASSYAPAVLQQLFWHHVGLFTAFTMAISLMSATSISGIAVTAALWVKNRYLTLAVPFLLYLLFIVAPQYLLPGAFMWAPHIMADAFWQFSRPVWTIVAYWLIPLIITLACMSLGARRYGSLHLLRVDYRE